ncbi:MAG: aa3-type cytochrome oxidase subunit IV [Candidatus Dormibacteria bacterium]
MAEDAEPVTEGHGSEDHLPGPSFWPAMLAVGVAMSLVGTITKYEVLIIGLIIVVVALGGWIRSASREYHRLS